MSVSTSAGTSQRPNAARKTCHTWVPVKITRATEAMQTRQRSSRMLQISTSLPSASRQWVMSACQRWLGCSAQNRRHDERGRFCGCGATNPRRDKIRQIVETAGTGETPAGERLAEPDDLILQLQPDRPRIVVWPSRPGLERSLALGLEAFDQGLHPEPGDAVLTGDRTLRAALHGDGGDHEPGHRHGAPPS